MSQRRLEPPGGDPAPTTAWLTNGGPLDLSSLAREICRLYRQEFPDEDQRYGDAGNAWCIHDNQHLLNWAVDEVNGDGDMEEQVAWLARVLESRDFPMDRLARNLDIGAHVALSRLSGAEGEPLAGVLSRAARLVRETFVD